VLAPYNDSRPQPQAGQPIHATLAGENCRISQRTLALIITSIGAAATLRVARVGFVRDRRAVASARKAAASG
jgi:hypothetical protein